MSAVLTGTPNEQDVKEANAVDIPSQLDDEALFKTLTTWFDDSRSRSSEWRKRAAEDFDFAAGEQWDEADKKRLEQKKRPAIVFNRTLAVIDAVAGTEIASRMDILYKPRTTQPGPVRLSEVMTGASKFLADGCDAEDEQSEAFWDTLVCGMGWTESRLDFDVEEEGHYVEEQIDPIGMYWDMDARKKNLQDGRYMFRVREMTMADARTFLRRRGVKVANPDEREVTPDMIFDEDIDAKWAISGDIDKAGDARPIEERRLRLEHSVEFDDRAKVRIVQAQWIENVPYYKVFDPLKGLVTMDQSAFEATGGTTGNQNLESVKLYRKVRKTAFLGARLLGKVQVLAIQNRFTWQCITGKKRRNDGTWFGLVRIARDPQMWANKWLSQILHILNTTAKGGILAEEDAFKDQREAQETYAQPDAITFVNKGAVSGGKITPKPGSAMPQGYEKLLEYAVSSIRDTTGVNVELLGSREADQPGVVEQMRKQAGLTILATLFDSMRRYRKNIGHVRLEFIQRYMSDGRIITVNGPDGTEQAIQLLRQSTAGNYYVNVADAPTSPNIKDKTWAVLQPLLPIFEKTGSPEIILLVLEYAPLPTEFVNRLRALAQQLQAQQAQPSPQAIAQFTAMLKELQSKAERNSAAATKDRSVALKNLADIGTSGAEAAERQANAMDTHSRLIMDLHNTPKGVPPEPDNDDDEEQGAVG